MTYGRQLRKALLGPTVNEAALQQSLRAAQSRMPVPVLWLLGKTQAGKTSIIRALTGSVQAEIGNGFQPCTRTARIYDFPADTPLVRFLDTRGLGEVAYQPDEDIAYCEARAHLVLAVMKVADLEQAAVFKVLRSIRARHPDWPVLVAQTGLHELYPPGLNHIEPWPFELTPLPESVPIDLRRALAAQRAQATGLPGAAPVSWVAIDLTLPEDGFEPVNYGLEGLWRAIEALSSFGLWLQLGADPTVRNLYARSAHLQTVAHAVAAAGLGALPVIDLVAVTAVQGKLLHALAVLYGQRLDRRTATEFLGLVGAGFAAGYLARMVGRSVVKLIPIWGQTLGAVWGASASGASTYALGKAAVYFFARRRDGLNVDGKALRQVYAEAFATGRDLLHPRLRNPIQ
jgi:uncharacterized protein (DUF697 family)/predicted GTPase